MRRFLLITALALTLGSVLTPTGAAITNGRLDGEEHPNVGILVFELTRTQGLFCTGTLVAPSVFLTAGHCTRLLESIGAPPAWVSFDSTLDLDAASLIPVTYATHPAFDPRTLRNDLGVALLDKPAAGIEPARLPALGLLGAMKADGTLAHTTFTTVGYGWTAEFKGGPPTYGWDGARRVATSAFAGLTSDSLVLLQASDATGQGGACLGDSGAPRFVGATNVIAAVTSGGDAVCRAIGFNQRLDTASAQAFLAPFVSTP